MATDSLFILVIPERRRTETLCGYSSQGVNLLRIVAMFCRKVSLNSRSLHWWSIDSCLGNFLLLWDILMVHSLCSLG